MSTLSARTPSPTTVEVRRAFESSKTSVWRALTEPSLVKRWLLGPPGWSMPVCESDFQVGGTYEYRWRSDEDGSEFGFVGEFQEIEPLSKIVHTEGLSEGSPGAGMAGDSLITISLGEDTSGTTVTTTIEYPSTDARDAALAHGMTDGMEMSYRQLDELLTTL